MPTRRFLEFLLILLSFGLPGLPVWAASERHLEALVLVNSQSSHFRDFAAEVEPYLLSFGVAYRVRDLARETAGTDLEQFALIIVGHQALDPEHIHLLRKDDDAILSAVRAGTGLVDFDGLQLQEQRGQRQFLYGFSRQIFALQTSPTATLTSQCDKVIVRRSAVASTAEVTTNQLILRQSMHLYGLSASPTSTEIASCGDGALIISARFGQGKAILWSGYDWIDPGILGRLSGLDDLVWKSLVWAARKPFVLRGMPHYLAMRVDDVSGFGIGSNQHLGWMSVALRYGLKPWVGVFLDDLRKDPLATQRLAEYTRRGLATASPHALTYESFIFVNEPLWTDAWNTNIQTRDLPDVIADHNLVDAGEFFDRNGIRRSSVVVPHYYEFGSNSVKGLQSWGAQFISTMVTPGAGYGTVALPLGPYLTHEQSRSSSASWPILISDWMVVPGQPQWANSFFDFVEEVRDVTGYEWAPSGVPVHEAIRRGIVQSEREFDSMLPAVLFTHESDHLQHLTPEAWDDILKGTLDGLSGYRPVPVTLDFLCEYMRALNTSHIQAASFDSTTGQITVTFAGKSDIPTSFYLFKNDADGADGREQEAPAFSGKVEITIR